MQRPVRAKEAGPKTKEVGTVSIDQNSCFCTGHTSLVAPGTPCCTRTRDVLDDSTEEASHGQLCCQGRRESLSCFLKEALRNSKVHLHKFARTPLELPRRARPSAARGAGDCDLVRTTASSQTPRGRSVRGESSRPSLRRRQRNSQHLLSYSCLQESHR